MQACVTAGPAHERVSAAPPPTHTQGTPGGDLAELGGAIAVYLEQTSTPVSQAAVSDAFNAFMRSGIITGQ